MLPLADLRQKTRLSSTITTSRTGTAEDSGPIEITLRFAEQPGREWPKAAVQKLRGVIQTDDAGRHIVILRVSVRYDDTTGESVPEWSFLNREGNRLSSTSSHRTVLHSLVRSFFLKSLRDAEQAFLPGFKFWKPFIRSMTMDPATRKKLEAELEDLNRRILDEHGSFGMVEQEMKLMTRLVPLARDDPVRIEAVPGRVSDVLARTQVTLTSAAGAKIPVGRHGTGTQSLAVISLFLAFLSSGQGRVGKDAPVPILTVEEPEAHLHPSAAYSVIDMLRNTAGQSIISTHSGDLVSKADVSSLRRLRRKGGQIALYQADSNAFSEDDIRKINYHIRSTRGNLLFARCWLLVEGETELIVFEGSALLCGADLRSKGVYCIPYRQLDHLVLIKLADQLGIEWLVVADGDQQGDKTVKSSKKELGQRPEEWRVIQLDGTLDSLLCRNGYGQIYQKNRIHPQKQDGRDPDWDEVVKDQRSKPATAGIVMEEMERRGAEGVPERIRDIIRTAVELAEGAQ